MARTLLILVGFLFPGSCMQSASHSLAKAPDRVETVNEIVTVYNHNLVEHFNKLTPQERTFIYYLMRASLPGNFIATDQSHRDAPKIKELLEFVFDHKDDLSKKELSFDAAQLLKEIEQYLIYLWTNHSQYFMREHADEKRTPDRLKLNTLNKENLSTALQL